LTSELISLAVLAEEVVTEIIPMMSARLMTKAKILKTRFVMSIDRFFIELPPFSEICFLENPLF
jgi:hypothetical protein